MNQKSLILKHIWKHYNNENEMREILCDISSEFESNSMVAIFGPSGSGKTTLINIIAGLDRPDGGEVWVGDRRLDTLGHAELALLRAKSMGIIFQSPSLVEHLTVLENVMLPMLMYQRKVDRNLALSLLEKLNLRERADRFPSKLSEGERRRVSVARGLISSPPLVLADEPTANVDETAGSMIIDLFRKQSRCGSCIVIATHDRNVLDNVDRAFRLESGRLNSLEPA